MISKLKRSVLAMPGSNARALEKGKSLAADVLMFELEDGVAEAAKETARQQVADAVRGGGYGARQIVVRVNAYGSQWSQADIDAIAPTGPDAIVSPKVSAARVHDIEIIDGIYNDFNDEEGLRRQSEQGRDMGFDGKMLIHPSQIGPVNQIFAPSQQEIDFARKILAIFDLPENVKKGVVQIDGTMVERLHLDVARRTLALMDAAS